MSSYLSGLKGMLVARFDAIDSRLDAMEFPLKEARGSFVKIVSVVL